MYKNRNATPARSKIYINRDEFILSFTPLVKSIAYGYFVANRQNVEIGDLVNYGFIGLIRAIESEGTEEINNLKSYFGAAIRNGIIDGLRESRGRRAHANGKVHDQLYEDSSLESLEKEEDIQTITSLLSALEPIEFQIISAYFHGDRMSEVSKRLGMGQSLGYKRKQQALEKMRGMREASKL